MAPLRRVKLTELNAHLVCVLCKGYFVDATTIIECLHTFCKACVVIHLQTSSFCPICEVQVHKTKPLLSLREDRTLQDVVFKLVPDLFRAEMTRRFRFYREHPEAGGDKTEQSLRERRHFFHVDDQISLSLEYLPSPPSTSHSGHLLKPLKISNGQQEKSKSGDEDKDVGKEEGKKEEEEKMPAKVIHKRYLKCPAAVQVSHLEKFIRLKYSLTPQTHRVDIMHGGDCLVGELTLLDVVYMYKWAEDAPLRLMYTVTAIPQTRKRPRPNGLRAPATTEAEAPASKVPKTVSYDVQQQPAHHLVHSQVHPVSGRDQDAVELPRPEETELTTIDHKAILADISDMVSVALTTAASSVTIASSVSIVSSHMSINIPSLPNTILNSGIQLPTPLPSGRRTAFTKTTASTATPRLAVPDKTFASTDSVSSVNSGEGVPVAVQVTAPMVTLPSSEGVSLSTITTSTNNNLLPVASLPVTTVPRATMNGLMDSNVNVNATRNGSSPISQANKIMQPIIPTKPRLGRPPNSSRVASLKPGLRASDNKIIRPVTAGKIDHKGMNVQKNNPTVSTTLNVQSRLSSISGPKLGNAKVSLKRLNNAPKSISSVDHSNKKSSSNPAYTELQSLVSMNNVESSKARVTSNDKVSDVTTSQACEVVDIQKSASSSQIQNLATQTVQSSQIQNLATQTVQSSIASTPQSSMVKLQKVPMVQGQQRLPNSTTAFQKPVQVPTVGVAVRPNSVNTCLPNISQPNLDQSTMNSKALQNVPKSSSPVQPVTRNSTSYQSTPTSMAISTTTTVSCPQPLMHPSSKPVQSSTQRIIPGTGTVRATTPTNVKTTMTTNSPRMAAVQPTSQMQSSPSPRAPTSQASLRSPISPAPHRTITNTMYRPPSTTPQRTQQNSPLNRVSPSTAPHRAPSPAPHRAPPSPAPHRAPPSPAPHRAPPSPAPHRAPPSPAPHRAPPSPAPHRAPPSPAPHRAPPSPAPHRAPPSPAPHRAPPSPAPHRAPPSPAPHRAPPSPAPHRAPPSPAPHRAPPSPAPHRAPPSPAPHRAPPSPAPHRAPPSPAPHRAPPSPAPHRAPPSPAPHRAPPSPAPHRTPNSTSAQTPQGLNSFLDPASPSVQSSASPATCSPASVASHQGQPKLSVNSKANNQISLQSPNQSATSVSKTTVPMSIPSKESPGTKTTATSIGSRPSITKTTLPAVTSTSITKSSSTPVVASTNSVLGNSESKVTSTKVSPNVKAPPKSPGRKKGSGDNSSILSIVQNLANRQRQQLTVNSTPVSNAATTSCATPTTQVTSQQPFTTTANAVVYPGQVGGGLVSGQVGGGLVSPALAAAYIASAYGGGDASAIADVTAMRNLITLSQTAACIREWNMAEYNMAAMVQAAEKMPRPSDPAPIDLSPTSKAAPQSPLTNGRNNTITTSPVSSSKATATVKSGQVKPTTSIASTPTISSPTPEVTITKLPSTPTTTVAASTTVTTSGKNVPGLMKLASSSTNTVSITKRPVANNRGNRIAVAKSPANASVRQIPNPSFLRHQSEVRNNNNVTKTSPLPASSAIKSNTTTTTVSPKVHQSTKQTGGSRSSTGNSPLKETGPLPETSSILKIENLTRSLAPAAAAAAAATSSSSMRFFDNR